MTVGDITDVALNATAEAQCEKTRADGVAAAVAEFNEAWRRWLRDAR